MLNKEHDIYGQCNCTLNIFGKEVKGRQVILPLPPTENRRLEVTAVSNFVSTYYAGARKKRVVHNSTQYARWLQAAATLLRKGKLPPYTEPVCVFITVVFPDNRVRDAQNREKALFDTMEKSGCLIDNDTNIYFHTTSKKIVKGKSFVLAYVFPASQMPVNPFEVSDAALQQIAGKVPDY